MTRPRLVSFLVLSLVTTTTCGWDRRSDEPSSAVHAPIVGGTTTSDWPSVGALVADVPGYGYMGPFCTGTLIAPSWVLTAAHCIRSYQGMPILPFFVKFYVGTDANASWGGKPLTGQLFQADEFFPHPKYDASMMTVGHDIGLVRLKDEVAGIQPVPINRRPLRGQHLGSRILFVGFGVSNGIQQTGSGIQRETTMPMTWFDTGTYYTEPDGSGTCNGDSGGPGLLQMDRDGTWSQIGVVSAGTESPGTPGDPCLTGIGIYTRVDAHVSWIAEVTGLTVPSCAQGVCLCDEACRPDGGCDDSVCRTRTCLESLACLSGCAADDDACRMDCRIFTKPEDEVAFDKIQYCIDTKCKNAADVLGCAQAVCSDRLNECIAHSGVDADCAAYAACRETCPVGASLCVFACDSGTSEDAKAAWTQAESCLKQADCPVVVSAHATQDDCAQEHCLVELEGCFPPPPCDPLGHDCPDGTYCHVSPDGKGRCVPPDDVAEEGIPDASPGEDVVPDTPNLPGGDTPEGDASLPDAVDEGAAVGSGSRGGCTAGPTAPTPWWLVLSSAAVLVRRQRSPAALQS